MAKLILALLVFLPAVAFAGGPSNDDMQQQMAQTKVVVQLPPDKGFFSSEVIAALIAGSLGLAGVAITLNARKKS
jgi:hypothetical protein